MVRILHAADFHLDSNFEGLPPEKARTRRAEIRETITRAFREAEARGAAVALLAGDIFDSFAPSRDSVRFLRELFASSGMKIFIAPGNHDPYTARSVYASSGWSGNVHIFKTPGITRVELPDEGCVVYGCAFSSASCEEPLLRGPLPGGEGLVKILVMHGDVSASGSSYNHVTRESLALCGADYVALGHTHAFSGVGRAGNTAYAYPGCIEPRGFDETGTKGVVIGGVFPGGAELQFVPIAKREYAVLHVDVGAYEDAEALGVAVKKQAAEGSVCRLILEGERGEIDRSAAMDSLTDYFFSLSVWDKTRLRRELWELCGEDTLRGGFMRALKARFDAAPEHERRNIELAARFGLAAFDGGEAPRCDYT